jgi:GH35 family endo-1,4-beta-xylanase
MFDGGKFNACRRQFAAAVCAVLISCRASEAQTVLNGNSLVLRSSGSAIGNSWTLNSNGYVGTYITLAQPGSVTIAVNASGQSASDTFPNMTVSIADYDHSFSVNSASSVSYSLATPVLPAGTYFVRTQLDNQTGTATPALTIANLQVSSNATVVNSSTDSLALAAANTYINNFRRGPVQVRMIGVPTGTVVNVDMTRNAFNFGGTVSGVVNADSKDMLTTTTPASGTEQAKFQNFINANFNTIVPSNGGKWASNEQGNTQPASPTMTLVDKQLNYAAAHGMQARMHNLIWGATQQPTWVNNLITQAQAGNTAAKTSLMNAITNRINYYVGGANLANAQRSRKYIEIDVLNEAHHAPSYWNIFGPEGIADIYNQVDNAIAAAGSNARTYLNEFNVLQFSPATINANGAGSGSDPYANWYRNQVEAVNNAGLTTYGKRVVTGIGFQLYASVTATGSNSLSTATMQKALQNLSVEGLPLSLTEFGLGSSTTMTDSQTLGPAALENTMRMLYGTPLATSFMMWGWWDRSTSPYPPAAMLDNTQGNSSLTPMGERWQDLMSEFSTHVAPTVDANGQVNFTGFYGKYDITVSGQSYTLDLTKGTSLYTLLVNPVQGDFNLDGRLTNRDIQSMLNALAGPSDYLQSRGLQPSDLLTLGDFNEDDVFNGADIYPMLKALAAGGASAGLAVHEPATLSLALFAFATGIRRAQKRRARITRNKSQGITKTSEKSQLCATLTLPAPGTLHCRCDKCVIVIVESDTH